MPFCFGEYRLQPRRRFDRESAQGNESDSNDPDPGESGGARQIPNAACSRRGGGSDRVHETIVGFSSGVSKRRQAEANLWRKGLEQWGLRGGQNCLVV